MISRRQEGCDDLATIDLEEGVSQGALARRKEHLDECEDCRIEQAVLNELSSAQGSGVLEQLEGIERQHFVEDIVDRSDRPEATQQEIQPRPLWNPLSLLSGAAIGAAATAAVFLIVSFLSETGEQNRGTGDGQEDITAQSVENRHEARLLFSTGEVHEGDESLELGTVAPRGRELRVEGQAVFELAPGLLVAFEPQTSFTLGPADTEASPPLIELHNGDLLASLTAEREGSQGLSIVTKRGQVSVTGTVVGVAQHDDDFEVSVLRGAVETQSGGSTSTVTAGDALSLGTSERRHLDEEETQALWERTRRLSMFTSRNGASVTLQTDPSAAEVLVDEVLIGVTPLHVSLRPGHHQVAFRVDERVVAHTVFDLRPNDVVSRTVTLEALVDTSESDAGDLSESHAESPHTPLPSAADGSNEQGASVEELLARAQTHRAQREFSQAASSYRELLRLYPNAAESRAVLVSLGNIELERLGSPAKALRLYDGYLRGQSAGSLAQEALWGKARALRALGRTAQERQTLELFLQRFSGALQSRSVRRRLDELGRESMDNGQ